jgi:ABC-2 type transport system permease protein
MRLSVSAEILKLRRQQAVLFWGFLFVPLFTTLLSCVLDGGFSPAPPGVTARVVAPLHSAIRALRVGGNPIAHLFYAVGAAALFAGEYRYSGWRHLVPRATRASLLVSKYATFAIFAAFSLTLAAGGDAAVILLLPLGRGLRPVVTDADGASALLLLTSFLISLAELMTLAAMVAFLATLSRAAIGAIIAPFLLSLTASLTEAWLAGSAGGAIPLPTFAGDALRTWATTPDPAPAIAQAALIGIATLAGWSAAGFGGAIWLFERQDLVGE